jgi:hypothetical protein
VVSHLAYLSKWEYLPAGAVVLKLHAMVGVLDPLPGAGALDDPVSLNNQGLPFPTSSGALQPLAYIEFGPTGAASPLTSGGVVSTLAFTEGFMTVVGAQSVPTPTSKTTGNTLLNVTTITADSLIGRVQVTRP